MFFFGTKTQNILYICRNFFSEEMIFFTGEYDCKIDAKGRLMLPIAFRRQMGEVEAYSFVVRKDLLEDYLELFTLEEWERQMKLFMSSIENNTLDNRVGLRQFKMGIAEVECDPTGRLLIPRRLLSQVVIKDEALLSGSIGKIDIWSPTLYNNSVGDEKTRRERAERIMSMIPFNL
jgi:MraZ protein